MKRAACFLLALIAAAALLCSCSSGGVKVPEPDDAFYVYDEANVLDAELEEYIISKNADLYEKCGGQIVIAAVKTTGSVSIEKYAYALFNEWGIGDREKHNGMLLLLSVEEDDYWALQGKGLEKLIQSGTLKLMLNDTLEPYFAKKQYGDGVRAFFDALIEKYEQIYSIQIDGSSSPSAPSQTQTKRQPLIWLIIKAAAHLVIVFAIVMTLIIVAITVFIIITSLVSAGNTTPNTFRMTAHKPTMNPYSFRPSGTSHHSTFGGTHTTFSSGSHHTYSSGHSSGGFFSGGHSSGGSSGVGRHSGGGGGSRGGGAGRR